MERETTIVAMGIHPFVVGTPDGAQALCRVLENFKNQKLFWVMDVQAVLHVAPQAVTKGTQINLDHFGIRRNSRGRIG
jgi:hypothetical protein